MSDAQGRTLRAVGSTLTEAVGTVQEDQFQGHHHEFYVKNSTYGTSGTGGGMWIGTTNFNQSINVLEEISNGADGTPRTGTETIMKNLTVGIPYIIVLKEV